MHVQSERVDMYYVRSQLAYGQPVSRQKKKKKICMSSFRS
jgi:hypothetical protein